MSAQPETLENTIFRVTNIQRNDGGTNRAPKVRVTLQNKAYTGLAAISWNELSEIEDGKIVSVTGELGEYRNRPQLKILQITVVKDYQGTDLVPCYNGSLAGLESRLIKLISRITDERLHRIVTKLLDEETPLGKKFRLAPASPADISHEPYLHGLWQHTLEVTEFALTLAENALRMRPEEYASINLSYLIFGGLVHDIGKTSSYKYGDDGIKFAVPGLLNGHLIEGYAIVRQALIADGFDSSSNETHKILHIIASHHGNESDNPPRFIEAILVHKADSIASQLGSTYGKPHTAPAFEN